MPVSPARAAAFDILLRVERQSSYASELLHSHTYDKLSVPDHSLTTELVMGVLRWRSWLDHQIASASSQPISKLDVEVLTALRLAVYQFRFLNRIPQHAALYESVELVKRTRKRSAAAFVNAVLRRLTAIKPEGASDESFSVERLSHDFAHPEWLVQRWTQSYGPERTRLICKHDQAVPVASIRPRNPNVEAQLIDEGITLDPGGLLATARRVSKGDITGTKAFREAQVTVQDEASQLVAFLVGGDMDNSNILDCCAAPGGKALVIADRNPQATVTAVELHPHRADLLQKLVRKARPQSRVRVIAADARYLPTLPSFDRVLVDVPCSGTGTLARNPEIKWRLQPHDLLDLQTRQAAILRSAMNYVRIGGRLIYSTCSMEVEENEDVVKQVLGNQSFELLDCGPELEQLRKSGALIWKGASLTQGPYLRTLQGLHPCDGFFAAILRRNK